MTVKNKTIPEISKRFRQFREEKKFSRRDISEKTGLKNADQVKSLELGLVNFSGLLLKILYYEYGLNEDWLRHGNGPMIIDVHPAEGSYQTTFTTAEPDAWYKSLLNELGEDKEKESTLLQMIIMWLVKEFHNKNPAQQVLLHDFFRDNFESYIEYVKGFSEDIPEKKREDLEIQSDTIRGRESV